MKQTFTIPTNMTSYSTESSPLTEQTVYSHESKWPVVPPLQETTQLYRAQKQMSLGLGNTNGEEWYRLRTNSQQKMLRYLSLVVDDVGCCNQPPYETEQPG